MANMLNWEIVSLFKLQLHYYVHFQINIAQSAGAVEYIDCTSAEG